MMKIIHILIVAAIAILSVAAGLAKVMQSQQEIEFLQGLGLSIFVIMVFGLLHDVGNITMVHAERLICNFIGACVRAGYYDGH